VFDDFCPRAVAMEYPDSRAGSGCNSGSNAFTLLAVLPFVHSDTDGDAWSDNFRRSNSHSFGTDFNSGASDYSGTDTGP